MGQDTLTHKRCTRCDQHKPTTEFYAYRSGKLRTSCKPCHKDMNRRHRADNPTQSMFHTKKSKAKADGIEFTLTFQDIVWNVHCPALGIELDYTRNRGDGYRPKPNSPSFDRIDPNKGYVPGNVIIVSNLANTIKSNATVDELERVAAFYRQLSPTNGSI